MVLMWFDVVDVVDMVDMVDMIDELCLYVMCFDLV